MKNILILTPSATPMTKHTHTLHTHNYTTNNVLTEILTVYVATRTC